MDYAIFNRPIVTICASPAETAESDRGTLSNIADEGLYGQVCRVEGETGENDVSGTDWLRIVTFYGYPGYVRRSEMILAGEGKLRSWLQHRYALIGRTTDVRTAADSASVCLLTLERGCHVELLAERAAGEADNGLPLHHDGWARVRLADLREGYVRDVALEPLRAVPSAVFYLDGQRTMQEALAAAQGITPERVTAEALARWHDGSEEHFRSAVCATARRYLGTQYRWGGKTPRGIDCSGLVSTAYLQNGITIYRDAKMQPGYPIHEIPFAQKQPGDLLYFPGHIAMYLGSGRYVHATGAAASGGVVLNSLDPADALYRADLPDKLLAVGSLF